MQWKVLIKLRQMTTERKEFAPYLTHTIDIYEFLWKKFLKKILIIELNLTFF